MVTVLDFTDPCVTETCAAADVFTDHRNVPEAFNRTEGSTLNVPDSSRSHGVTDPVRPVVVPDTLMTFGFFASREPEMTIDAAPFGVTMLLYSDHEPQPT